jgi:hypothetical protein
VRRGAVLFVLALIGAACGSSGDASEATGTPPPGTLEAFWRQPGEDVGLVNGTSDFAPGRIRLAFLVIDGRGRPIYRPEARVWIAEALRATPFEQTRATLESVGLPGAGEVDPAEVTQVYVAHVDVPKPGKYWVLAEPVGGTAIQALGNVVVKPRAESPAVGDPAPASDTPTIASAGGDLARITTATPPDTELLRYSIAESLAAGRPFVVAFATPKYCTSRTCGPVVDVVDRVRSQLSDTGVRFIHVEIYEDNDPSKGTNRWVKEWRLPTEPWIFLVGRDGRVKAKFEGAVSVNELATAVKRFLT